VILVFIYPQKILKLNKGVLYHIILIFLFIVTNKQISGQSLDNPIYTYKGIFDSTNTSPALLEKFKYLEDNWYCIEDRDWYISNVLNEDLSPRHIEYLKILQFLNYIHTFNYSKANHSLKYYNDLSDASFPGRIKYLIAYFYLRKQNISKSLEYFKGALSIFKDKDNPRLEMSVHISFIPVFIELGDLKSASEEFSKAQLIGEKYDFKKEFIRLYTAYGKYMMSYDKQFSKELFEKAYQIAKEDTSRWSIRLRVEYLRFLLSSKDMELFRKILNESLFMFENNCMDIHYSIILTFIAHVHDIERNFDSAIIYNKKALELRKKVGNGQFIGLSFLNIQNDYLHKRNITLSKKYLDSTRYYLFEGGNLESKQLYLQQSINYFNVIKNKDSLIEQYNKLLEINDNYFSEQQRILAENIRMKSEINIKLQQEKYELELSKRKNRFIYMSIISILSIIVIVFLIFRIRSKNIRFNNLFKGALIDRKALKEYQRELEQLKTIFKNAPKGFFIINQSYQILYFNSSAQKMFRHKGNMELKDSIFSFIPKYFHESLNKTLDDVYELKEDKEIIIDLIDVFQNMRKINISISPMIVNNNIESTLFIITDITESETALESEKQQRRVLQTLINSVTESILLMDHNLKIKLLNNTAAARFGSTVEELIGENYLDILPPSLRDIRKDKLDQVFNSKEAIVFNEDVDSYNSMISFYPNINKMGEIEFVAEFSQDITERKLASEQINSLRQKVLRSQMNPHFIFNSLNAIQSYVLKNEATTAVKYLNSFARLIRMILDSSRYDYITLTKEVNILQYYLDLQQLRFGDKFVYQLEIDDSLDTDALLIPAMLAQPFIENAIEHGLQHLETKGTVKISFIHKNDSIVFKVIDNGIGRDASMKIQENIKHKSTSLSTKLFKERLYTLNKYSGQKITYNIVDLKDNNGVAKGTMVVINLPLIYKTDISFN